MRDKHIHSLLRICLHFVISFKYSSDSIRQIPYYCIRPLGIFEKALGKDHPSDAPADGIIVLTH